MYVRLFQRRTSDRIFAQLCDGNDLRDVLCLETADHDSALSRVRDLITDKGKSPDTVPVIWDMRSKTVAGTTVSQARM